MVPSPPCPRFHFHTCSFRFIRKIGCIHVFQETAAATDFLIIITPSPKVDSQEEGELLDVGGTKEPFPIMTIRCSKLDKNTYYLSYLPYIQNLNHPHHVRLSAMNGIALMRFHTHSSSSKIHRLLLPLDGLLSKIFTSSSSNQQYRRKYSYFKKLYCFIIKPFIIRNSN